MTRIVLILGLTLLASAPRATAQGPLRWTLGPDDVVRFKLTNLPPPKGRTLVKVPAQWTGVGAELAGAGTRWAVTSRWQMALAAALQLPDRPLKQGRNAQLRRTLEHVGDLGAVDLIGGLKHVEPATFEGLPCQRLRLKAQLVANEKRGEDRTYKLIRGGVEARTYWHAERGHILGGEAIGWWTFKHRVKPAKGPLELTHAYRFKFKLDLMMTPTDPRLTKLINAAIDKGVKWLRTKQYKTGTAAGQFAFAHRASYPLGSNSLALLALLASGVKPDDPQIVKGFEAIKDLPFKKTYGAGVYLMALEARYMPTAESLHAMKPEARREALAAVPAKVSAADRARIAAAVKWLLGGEDYRRAKWGYPHAPNTRNGYDNSNVQYAVLGLLAADRLGGAVPPSAWTDIMKHWLMEQDTSGKPVQVPVKDGQYVRMLEAEGRGWNYRRPSRGKGGSYGSMTCAGVASVAIARSRLQALKLLDAKDQKKCDQSVRDGLAWLQSHWDLRRNPVKGAWHYYYLYGLERAGVLAGVQRIGRNDWYRQGAALLVGWQHASGYWANPRYTAYALLFLKKGTAPVEYSGGGK